MPQLPQRQGLIRGHMHNTSEPSLDILRRFDADAPELVAETSIARVFRVQVPDIGVAALKLYRRTDMGHERAGIDYMRALHGHGVVRIYDHTQTAVLMEWLDGPSLGDLARQGAEDHAAQTLLDVACHLHANPMKRPASLTNLTEWFAALFALRFAPDCPQGLQADIRRAQAMAKRLLAEGSHDKPLHGDLHHDNVRLGARGYLAFDAKGLLGDPAYELANAFRHPLDQPHLVCDPARIDRLAHLWSDGLGVPRPHLLQWACAKCAMSIAWRRGPILSDDKEADLLAVLLHCASVH